MTSRLDWVMRDIQSALIKVRADGVKALEVLDTPKYEKEDYMRGHFRARVSLAEDILDMIYKNEVREDE